MVKRISLLILLVMLTACANSSRDRRSSPGDEPTPIPTAVTPTKPIYTVEKGQVVYQLEFSGRIAPVVEQALAFSIDGTISQVHVRREDTVQGGELIAELDTSGLEADLVLAQSALDIAQTRLDTVVTEKVSARRRAELRRDLAQLDLDYARTQAGDEPTAEQQYQIDRLSLELELAQLDLDQLDTTVDPVLQADVQQAALRVAELENAIANAVLYAPFGGQIISLNAAAGRTVSVGQAIGVIADPSQIDISANLRDKQLQEMVEDMRVTITAIGRPGDPLDGTVRRLPYPYGRGGELNTSDAGEAVRISFDQHAEASSQYQLGDRVDVSIVIIERNDALWLPPAAIRDFNGRKFVVVQSDGAQQRIDVTLGITGDGRVEILDGLAKGQTIIGQ